MKAIRHNLVTLAARLKAVIDDKVYPVSKKSLKTGLRDLNLIIDALDQVLSTKKTNKFKITDGSVVIKILAEEVKIDSGALVFYINNKIIATYPKIVKLEIV